MNRTAKTALALVAAGVGTWMLTRPRRGNFDFRGKVVVVTGGSRGLGLILARQLTDQGAKVAICARSEDELNRAADELTQRGGYPLALPCDVTDPQQVRDFVRAVEVHLGPVDVLINNAGIIEAGPVESMTRADFERAMNTNFWGAYNAIEAVLPHLRARGQGRIVNIASIGGKIAVPHLLPYTASKFALVGYSEGLTAELAQSGVRVTTIVPGLMRTGSVRHARFKGQHRAEHAWFAISDSLPILSMNADRAAAQIIEACRRGDAEAILSLPAQAAVKVHDVFPNLFAGVLALADRLLPGPGGIGTRSAAGRDSQSPLAPSVMTTLTDRAAVKNNAVAPEEAPPSPH